MTTPLVTESGERDDLQCPHTIKLEVRFTDPKERVASAPMTVYENLAGTDVIDIKDGFDLPPGELNLTQAPEDDQAMSILRQINDTLLTHLNQAVNSNLMREAGLAALQHGLRVNQ
jgi:hypothetical protein